MGALLLLLLSRSEKDRQSLVLPGNDGGFWLAVVVVLHGGGGGGGQSRRLLRRAAAGRHGHVHPALSHPRPPAAATATPLPARLTPFSGPALLMVAPLGAAPDAVVVAGPGS